MDNFFCSGDPFQDFEDHENYVNDQLAAYPKCACCYEPVVQETAVRLYGKWFCDPCLEGHREVTVDDE